MGVILGSGGSIIGASTGLVNVRDMGAVGDGVIDDTAAIEAAFALGRGAYFPQGSYLYSGAGITRTTQLTAIGDGMNVAKIVLAAGSSFITTTGVLVSMVVKGLTFDGGFGAIRLGNTSSNVVNPVVVEDCQFKNYTGTAISHQSTDYPMWKIQRCQFQAANYASTMGIAITGLTDSCTISDCSFLANRVHVKVGYAGNNAHIDKCDFLRFATTATFPRVDVWVVPRPTGASNNGAGFTITQCKFGNENVATGDLAVLYADEAAGGTTFADKFPDLATESTGLIVGHVLADNNVMGATAIVDRPFVFSTTKQVRNCVFGPVHTGGTQIAYLLKYLNAPTADRLTQGNVLGPIVGDLATEQLTALPSNGTDVGAVIDPTDRFSTYPTTQLSVPGGADPAGVVALQTVALSAYTLAGSATLSTITDAVGGANGVELVCPSGGSIMGALVTGNIKPGVPAWIEFDLSPGATSPLASVRVALQYTSNGATHWRRWVVPPATGWARYRFPWVPREASTTTLLIFGSPSVAGQIKIGRVRVYHAREPQIMPDLPVFSALVAPPVPAVGQFFYATSPGGQTASSGIGNGSMRVAPWLVPKALSIDRLGVEVSVVGDAGSKVRPVIYTDNGNGYPGTLVVDGGQLAGDAVAAPAATVANTLPPGLYWIGGAVQAVTTTSPTLRCIVAGWNPPILLGVGTSLASGTALAGYAASSITAAAPSTFPSGAATTGTIPRTYCRAA